MKKFWLVLLTLGLMAALAGCESAAELTPAPTWTARVVQVVVTATFTPTPPATPTPTATATPLPSPTATATPVPTDTPVPTATNTPKPTAKPAATRTPAPPPTATTPPLDYIILSGPAGERTPATTNFKGHVYDAAGQPLNGVWLYLREAGGWEAWTVTGYSADPPGYYSYGLKDYSVNGSWGLCIVPEQGSREAISPWATFETSFNLEISTFTIDWQRTY